MAESTETPETPETPKIIERRLFEAVDIAMKAFEPFGRLLRIETDADGVSVDLDPVSHVEEIARPNAQRGYIAHRGQLQVTTIERRGFAGTTKITLIVGGQPED